LENFIDEKKACVLMHPI